MEAYKSECPDCGAVYFWQGFKTSIGKTEKQLEEIKKQQTICRECGKGNLKTALDHESDAGKEYDEMYKSVFDFIAPVLGKRKSDT